MAKALRTRVARRPIVAAEASLRLGTAKGISPLTESTVYEPHAGLLSERIVSLERVAHERLSDRLRRIRALAPKRPLRERDERKDAILRITLATDFVLLRAMVRRRYDRALTIAPRDISAGEHNIDVVVYLKVMAESLAIVHVGQDQAFVVANGDAVDIQIKVVENPKIYACRIPSVHYRRQPSTPRAAGRPVKARPGVHQALAT